jgi:predicted RNA binding protein with dsRBD fold (UPF0201 family)
MKSLKMLSLLVALFFISMNGLVAQSKADNLTEEQKETLAKNIEDYFEALNLTEVQKTEFEAITKKYAEKMKAVKDGGGRKLQKYRTVKPILKDKNKEIKKLLSEEQYKVYLDKQAARQKEMKERRSK